MTETLFNEEAIIRGVNYSTRNGYRVTLEIADQESWERLRVAGPNRRVAVVMVPISDDETPDADTLAKINKPSRAKQAGIMCEDAHFQAWLEVTDAYRAASRVRDWCGVPSRVELDRNARAASVWDEIVSDYVEDTGRNPPFHRELAPR